jgi:prevent-host-death family protein
MSTKRQIAAGEFKAKCLHLLDEVGQTRQELVITKRGKPVAKLVPVEEKPPTLFGRMKGTGVILGDIVGPTGVKWEADSDDADLSLYASPASASVSPGRGRVPKLPRATRGRSRR